MLPVFFVAGISSKNYLKNHTNIWKHTVYFRFQVAFGHWAGLAGAINALNLLGMRLLSLGLGKAEVFSCIII